MSLDHGGNSSSTSLRYSYTCHVSSQFYGLYQPHQTIMMLSVAVNALLLLIIPTLNILVVIVVFRTKRLHSPSNILLVGTAIIDALNGSVSNLLFSLNFLLAYHRTHDCGLYDVNYASIQLFASISFLMVVAINIDRYIAIIKPYFYNDRIVAHPLNYVYFTIIVWIGTTIVVSVAIVVPFLFLLQLFSGTMFIGTLLLCFYIHVVINATVKRVSINIKQNSVAVINNNNNNNNRNSGMSTASKKHLQKQLKVAMLSISMLASMLICCTPYFVCLGLWISGRDDDSIQTLNMWAFTCSCMKSLINPVLYCYSLSSLRVQVKRILGFSIAPESVTETTAQ